jgi:hypothetical protein
VTRKQQDILAAMLTEWPNRIKRWIGLQGLPEGTGMAAMAELERLGWVARRPAHDGRGQWRQWEVTQAGKEALVDATQQEATCDH